MGRHDALPNTYTIVCRQLETDQGGDGWIDTSEGQLTMRRDGRLFRSTRADARLALHAADTAIINSTVSPRPCLAVVF